MKVGDTVCREANKVLVFHLKKRGKGDKRVCNYQCNTLLRLPGKAYPRVLERRRQLLVELWIQEEQSTMHPGLGTVDQLFILAGFLGFAHSMFMHVFNVEKAYNRVSWKVLLRVPWEYPFITVVRAMCVSLSSSSKYP